MPYADPKRQREYLTTYARDVFGVRHKERLRQYQRNWELKNPEKYLWHAARARARKAGLEFTIGVLDIVIPSVCPILGIPLEFQPVRTSHRSARANAPSVDRIDPSKGYTKDNIRVISFRANHLKGNGTLAEFSALVKYLEQLAVDK